MIKKQALLLFRNPVELLLLLGLPVILITILGNALGSLMDGGELDLTFKMAVVEHETEAEQVERFKAGLEESGLPSSAIHELRLTVENFQPVETFLEVMQSEELKDMIMLETVEPNRLNEVKNDESFAVIVEFPESFSYDFLSNMLLDEEPTPKALIHYKRGSEIAGNVVEQILTMHQEEFTVGAFLGKNGIDPERLHQTSTHFKQDVSSISPYHPVTAKAYYTIGMIVMNVLFLAATMANYAFQERNIHIFDRMILANVSRWTYFVSVLLSGFLFALLQSLFVFAFAYFFFGVKWPDFASFFVITVFFALAVGGISVLLTAISFKNGNEQITGFFSGIVVTIVAFLGGSFFPIGEGSFLQKLGDFTPNGAAMSAYLSIMRGEAITANLDHLMFIACFALGAILIGAITFPKRGASP